MEVEAVMGAYFVEHVRPFEVLPHPAPSPGSPGSPTRDRCHESYHVHCHSCGVEEEEEEAVAGRPWVTAPWEPWQSFVWSGSPNTSLSTVWERPEQRR